MAKQMSLRRIGLSFLLVGFVFGDFTRSAVAAPHRSQVFTLGDVSPRVLFLHECLAQLGYLPVQFRPLTAEEDLYMMRMDSPSAGTWSWRYLKTPSSLKALWDPITFTPITRGAVMTFELEHHMVVDGYAGPRLFRALELALWTAMRCTHPYTHVLVDQSVPQSISVWQEGREVFRSACSTGIPQAPTHAGTHVIYLRNVKQTMDGETPDGRRYSVDNVPYVSFFYRGEAIHGLRRASYGTAQSVGCVEIPIGAAKIVWRLTDYGTLVTVTPG